MSWEREELIALVLLLALLTSMAVLGKLSPEYVQGVEWVAGAFFGSKGIQGLLPGNKE